MNRIAKIRPAMASPNDGVNFKGVQAFTAARIEAATNCTALCRDFARQKSPVGQSAS